MDYDSLLTSILREKLKSATETYNLPINSNQSRQSSGSSLNPNEKTSILPPGSIDTIEHEEDTNKIKSLNPKPKVRTLPPLPLPVGDSLNKQQEIKEIKSRRNRKPKLPRPPSPSCKNENDNVKSLSELDIFLIKESTSLITFNNGRDKDCDLVVAIPKQTKIPQIKIIEIKVNSKNVKENTYKSVRLV
jgi:hypothetical protein